jgi:hypothetical protein
LLAYVLWFMDLSPNDPGLTGMDPLALAIFGVLAFATLPAALFVRNLLLKATGDFKAPKRGLLDTSRSTLTGQEAAVGRVTNAAITGMAIPESSVLLGFIATFMTGDWRIFIPFALWGVIGWGVMYPRPSQVRAWYARQMGQDLPHSIIT